MEELQGTPFDNLTQDDVFDPPVEGESEAQALPVDFMAIFDKEDSLMNEVSVEDVAGCSPPTPPAPSLPSPLSQAFSSPLLESIRSRPPRPHQ